MPVAWSIRRRSVFSTPSSRVIRFQTVIARMSEFSPNIVAAVVQACQLGAEEAAGALNRTLDSQVKLVVGNPDGVTLATLQEPLAGPGLVVVLTVGGAGSVVLLPESSGLLPSWCANPDATGTSKLTTLAQELGMILLPEEFMPEDFAAGCVGNLGESLRAGEVAADAAVVPLELQQGGSTKTMYLVWPVAKPGNVLSGGGEVAKPEEVAKPQEALKLAALGQPAAAKPARRSASADELPLYVRSLLRIRVPVVVTLAEKRQSLNRIMELGPGSIIQFEKSCEEMLDLDIGGRRVASGEAVKVGDKFGLRISGIVLPEERFNTLCKEGGQVRPGKRIA